MNALDRQVTSELDSVASEVPLFRQVGRKKAYEEVAEQIRERVFTSSLKLGQRLPSERELAAQFGVSRVAVREAIRALETTGLLAVKKGPKGGIFVAQNYERPITDSIANLLAGGEARLEDLFEVRKLIEPYAAARVAEIGTDEDFAVLAALVDQAQSEHHKGNSIRHINIELHRQIIRMSRNPVLGVVGETVLLILADRLKPVVSHEPSGLALGMHKKLLIALRRRQPDTARSIMVKDIASVGKRFARLRTTAGRPAKGPARIRSRTKTKPPI